MLPKSTFDHDVFVSSLTNFIKNENTELYPITYTQNTLTYGTLSFGLSGINQIGSFGHNRQAIFNLLIEKFENLFQDNSFNDLIEYVKIIHDVDNKYDKSGSARYVVGKLKDIDTEIDFGWIPKIAIDSTITKEQQFNKFLEELHKTKIINIENITISQLKKIFIKKRNGTTKMFITPIASVKCNIIKTLIDI